MLILFEVFIILILMPFFIKWHDWGWWSCLTFIALCLMFTPLGGVLVYLLLRH